MQLYPGIDTVPALDTLTPRATFGVWPGPQEAQGGDLRSAANLMTMGETLTDRANFLGWRVPNWIDGGTQQVFGTVIMNGNGGSTSLEWIGVPTLYGAMPITYLSSVTVTDEAAWTHSGGHTISAGEWTYQAGTILALDGTTQLGAVPPSPTADPGAGNLLFGVNTCKAWGFLRNVSGVVTVQDGYNVSGAAPVGLVLEVTMARAMSDAHYSVLAAEAVITANVSIVMVDIISTTKFRLALFVGSGITTNTETDLTTVSVDLMFQVFGSQ